jgi:hypothetical protein
VICAVSEKRFVSAGPLSTASARLDRNAKLRDQRRHIVFASAGERPRDQRPALIVW